MGMWRSSRWRRQVDEARIPSYCIRRNKKGIAREMRARNAGGRWVENMATNRGDCTFFSFLAIWTPHSFSATKQVMPLYPLLGSKLAKIRKIPASAAFVTHILDPLSLYPSAVFSAFVFKAKASDPEAGSERQNEPSFSVAN